MVVERSRKVSAPSLAGTVMILVGLFIMLLAVLGVSVAGATQPNPEHKITLCHRTDSYTNPYVTESVDVASALFEGHDGHNGPVFYAAIPKGTKWGDIIPAFDFGPGEQYAGKNVPEGQAILDNDCVLPDTTTTSSSTSTTSTTQPQETTTSSTTSTTTTSTTEPASTTTVTVAGVTAKPGPGVSPQGTPADPTTSTVVPGAINGGGTLPFTGSPGLMLLGVGGALVASGTGLVLRRRNWAGAARR